MMLLAQGSLTFPDYFILVGYFVLMLGVGLYFARHMRGIKDYFKGGNTIPWWLSGVSHYMTSFSVAAFVFYPSLCYQYGFVGVTALWVGIPAALASGLIFGRAWRRARVDSPVEYLETRYSPLMRQLFAWQGVPVKLIDDALKLISTGIFLSVSLGVAKGSGMAWSIIGAGILMLAYTFLGGLWAVAVTDFLQFVVLTAAIIVVLPLSIQKAGGISAFFENAPAGSFSLTAGKYGWTYIACLVLLYVLAWSAINWSLIQRFYCVPREKDAKKVGLVVAALYVIGPPLMFLPALAARQFLPGLESARDVYPELCKQLLPPGMMGLVVAGMFAATMSTLSGDYNVCASVLTTDVYRRLIRRDASQKELVFVGRLMTLLVGVVAIGAAFLMAQGSGEKLFRTMVTLFSIATAPVAIPMLAGLVSRRVSNIAALAAFLAGLAVGLTLFFWGPETLGGELQRENIVFLGSAAATLAAMLIVTGVTPMPAEERARVDAFHARLDTPIGDLEEDRGEIAQAVVISPFRVVGISTALIGVLMIAVLPWVKGGLAIGLDLALGLGFTVVGVAMALVARPRA